MMIVGSVTEMPSGMEILHNMAATTVMENKVGVQLGLLYRKDLVQSEAPGYFTFFLPNI
ncbi:hypothetical protein CDL12_30492 [Handroanthus impetiginosus]|uniref:Uncharacterized protein n=1 Tax=Handroanthus impetiginosus TaxID=429701 RepID=A0A2G9FVB4_9LAMI|nr:hypothetical protein CDL12_30492 [Handroanthus impetiginosus]